MEELEADKKKKIVNRLVSELGKESIDLYYTDSSTIANMVVQKIHEGKLPKSEFDLVKKLTFNDVLILMSYNTSCC